MDKIKSIDCQSGVNEIANLLIERLEKLRSSFETHYDESGQRAAHWCAREVEELIAELEENHD